MEKAFIRFVSLVKFTILKLRYGKRISMQPVNPIRGMMKINLANKSARIVIGKNIMSKGPLYLKISGSLRIGENCFFNHNVSITCNEAISIGNHCNIANNVVIVDHDHVIGTDGVYGETKSSPITIGDRVWIGANAVITKGTRIGDGAVVAAGGVVTKDIPSHQLWGGVPATMIKRLS